MKKATTPKRRRAKLGPLEPFVSKGASPDELATRLSAESKAQKDGTTRAKDDDPDEDTLLTARKRFQSAMEANGPWSTQAAIDLKWRAGMDGDRSYQWPVGVQQQRDLEQRPFETVNFLPASIKQVTNQQRQAGLTMNVVPLKGPVSAQAAEVREGLLRHTMFVSDGETQVDTIFEDMATHGKGYAEVVSRFEDEDENPTGEQELFMEWRDPFAVFIDPTATKLDKSDMKYAFIPFDLPTEDYNALYPDSQIAKEGSLAWQGLDAGERTRWFPNGCVRIARYYTVEDASEPVEGEGTEPGLKRLSVTLRIINALEVLKTIPMVRTDADGKTVRALKRIPIVPMLGDRFVVDGKEDYRGMVRLARGPQRMLNFWITNLEELIASWIGSPWLVGWSQLEGFEQFWNQNKNTLKYLPYKDKNADGSPANQNPPHRNAEEPPIAATVVAINIAKDSLQHVLQIFDPSLGKAKSDQSGTAIQSLQQQGEIGNSNYLDNLKRFLRSLGRLLLQMYPIYYDTARIRRIVGKENNPLTVFVHAGAENAPGDDQLAEEKLGIESVFDLAVGQYDVAVSTSPSFLSKRQEANANLLQIWKMAPATLPMSLDVFLENGDFPGNTELAARAKRTISAPFQTPDPNDAQQQIGKIKQVLDQAMQQHDLLVKELNEKNKLIESDTIKAQSDQAIKLAEIASRERIAAYKGEVDQAINAAKLGMSHNLAELQGRLEQMQTLLSHVHEATMAQSQRDHDLAITPPPNGNGAIASAPPTVDTQPSSA